MRRLFRFWQLQLLTLFLFLIARAKAAYHPVDDAERDRGSDVVSTIILVAGFAILAFVIYSTVSGKVRTWVAKIP